MERAIDFYAAALPIVAGSFADRQLQRRHHELSRDTDRQRVEDPRKIASRKSCASSRVPLRTTVISWRPGSTPPAVADSSSAARAPVDT
jgi:hypothetical protein